MTYRTDLNLWILHKNSLFKTCVYGNHAAWLNSSSNLPIVFRKNSKQSGYIVVEDNVFYRLFFDDFGKIKNKQYCVPKFLWREVTYRLHHSLTAGYLRIVD